MTEPDGGLDFSYDPYLSQVPEALRGQIEPAFKSYSEGVQNKVTEQYSALDPYKEINDAGWTPEHVTVGLDLLQQLNSNPQAVLQAIAQEYPDLMQQFTTPAPVPVPNANPGQQNNNSTDMDIPPALQQRLDQQEQIIQLLYKGYEQNQQQSEQQMQMQQEQAEMAQFSKQLDQIAPEDKYPRPFILSYIAQGQTPQEAVKSFTDWQTGFSQQQRSAGAPLIAPASGGGLPSEPIDTAKLSDTDRKSLITQYLEAANRQT